MTSPARFSGKCVVITGAASGIVRAAALLFASEAAGFVTGTSLVVDGGITIGPRHAWDPETPGLFDALTAMAGNAGVTVGGKI